MKIQTDERHWYMRKSAHFRMLIGEQIMSLTRRQLLGAAGAASLYLYGCKPTAV